LGATHDISDVTYSWDWMRQGGKRIQPAIRPPPDETSRIERPNLPRRSFVSMRNKEVIRGTFCWYGPGPGPLSTPVFSQKSAKPIESKEDD